MVIELDDIEEDVENIELHIAGKFLTEQSVNFNILRNRIASVWRHKKMSDYKGDWPRQNHLPILSPSQSEEGS